MQSRYREEESLLSLNIVEMKNSGKDIKLYGLTSFGREIMESIRERK
jgi:predicted transcriptional regulator with HTH domain